MWNIKWFIILILFFANSFCFAEEFYQSRTWLNLLYYEKIGEGYRSLAEDYHFFVSQYGKTDPKSEYELSLKLTKQQDIFFRKTFPLRYKVITQINQLPFEPLVTPNQDIQSVMLVYPNRYMANPASMFGHLFLILKSKYGLLDSNILHYIADTQGASQYSYIINGLTGQFKGWFLQEPYYKKIKDYNYVEDREITYFDLKLSDEQIQNLQLHAIELKQSYFYYYFLDKNCAFFIGKLLNVILNQDIVSNRLLIFPSEIVNQLITDSLLKNEYQREASTKLFNESFNQLLPPQKLEVIDLISHKINQPQYNPNVLRTFLYISEYLINNESSLASTIRYNRIQAYNELNSHGVSDVRLAICKQPTVMPIKSKGLSIGYGFSNQLFLSYNPIFYSQYENFNELESKETNCLAPRFSILNNGKSQLDITLVDITSLSQQNIVFDAYSWKVNSFFAYQNSLLLNQSFELGKAFNVFNQTLVFGFLGFNYSNYDQIMDRPIDSLTLTPSLLLGIGTQIIPNKLNTQISYQYRYNNHYLTSTATFKVYDYIVNFTYIYGEKFNGIRVIGTYIF